jgi:hypothetical protein
MPLRMQTTYHTRDPGEPAHDVGCPWTNGRPVDGANTSPLAESHVVRDVAGEVLGY